jgi:hypothetical protein
MRRCQVAATKKEARLFRNNVGVLRDAQGQYVAYGLCKGSSDLIGWKSIIISSEMVGKRVAVFTACEVKLENGKLTKEQANFLSVVHREGGIAICARSQEDAVEGLDGYKPA